MFSAHLCSRAPLFRNISQLVFSFLFILYPLKAFISNSYLHLLINAFSKGKIIDYIEHLIDAKPLIPPPPPNSNQSSPLLEKLDRCKIMARNDIDLTIPNMECQPGHKIQQNKTQIFIRLLYDTPCHQQP